MIKHRRDKQNKGGINIGIYIIEGLK